MKKRQSFSFAYPLRHKVEVWKDVSGFEGLYQVSNIGRVKSLHHGEKIMNTNGKRYCEVDLRANGIKKRTTVHRLVATAFIENPFNKQYINHKNGIKKDNRVENLEWCTGSENTIHAFSTGLIKLKRQFNESQVNEIRSLEGVLSTHEISKKFGCHRWTVSQIFKGIAYKTF